MVTVSEGGIDPEIGKLVTLAHRSSPEGRAELYLTIAGLMESRASSFTAIERDLLNTIMAQLSRQVEMEVRFALAERMAEQEGAPHDLILILANDRIEVAAPILERSMLLSQNDLIDIINASSQPHQLRIAGRPDVTPLVAASLAESSAIEVLITLVRNQRARIAAETMEALAERSRESEELQRGVLTRPEMRTDLAERMCAFVSEALHGFIVERFRIDPATVRRGLELAAATAHARLTNASGPERLINKLHAAGQLKAGFAMKALSQGQLDVFEHAVAKIIGAPVEGLARLLKSGDAKVLALVCQAVGIDRSAFATLFSQAETLRGRSGILSPQDRAAADSVFQTLRREDARQTVLRRAA
jgi:uncharacterized protein (DUF2336 family)